MASARCISRGAVMLLTVSIAFVSVFSAQQATEKSKTPQPVVRTHFIVASSEVKWTNAPTGMSRGTPSVDALRLDRR
jgi:hypothetical protein